jgi:TPR repeat protein
MKKAADYLLQAAESGLPEAQFAIANYYRDGTGVAKDMDAARQWYERAASAGFEPARKELAAIDKPAVSSTPAVEEAAPANDPQTGDQPADTQQAQKTETPPAEPAKTETPPAETQSGASSAGETPPSEAAKQEPASPVEAPPVEAATTGHAPEQAGAGQAGAGEEEQDTGDGAAAQPSDGTPPDQTAEGSHAPDPNDPQAELPVAESLTGDAHVYRIWLYESGQEGDARSYWNKLTMQYPGLLKKLELDLRRYFLGDARGALYRVFAGPFESLGEAQQACADIKARSSDQMCRPVLN